MKIIVTRPTGPHLVERLKGAGHEVLAATEDSPGAAAAILAAGKDAEGMIAFLSDRIDGAFLDEQPRLKAVSNLAVGYDNIDVAACTARRVGASNTPGVLTDATAETAWTLIMMAARRAGEGERAVRGRRWTGWGPLDFVGVNVIGATLGIVGAGRIGGRVARLGIGFGMTVQYHNRRRSAEMDGLGAKLVGLEELLKASDFVSLHVPLTAETRHLIGARELALMKPTGILINTARGPVVDEGALVEALKARRIYAAGLDVYEKEPVLHPGLYELENVVLLPHIGSATAATRRRMADLAAENLLAMLAGKRPAHPLNPELWDRSKLKT
jgi:glyoxylate reductase